MIKKPFVAAALATGILLSGCGVAESVVKDTVDQTTAPARASSPYDKPGYITELHDGRLWLFMANSKEYAQFKQHGEPAKVVTRIGAGPNRMTIKSTDASVIDGYLNAMN